MHSPGGGGPWATAHSIGHPGRARTGSEPASCAEPSASTLAASTTKTASSTEPRPPISLCPGGTGHHTHSCGRRRFSAWLRPSRLSRPSLASLQNVTGERVTCQRGRGRAGARHITTRAARHPGSLEAGNACTPQATKESARTGFPGRTPQILTPPRSQHGTNACHQVTLPCPGQFLQYLFFDLWRRMSLEQ